LTHCFLFRDLEVLGLMSR